jgi:salicylate hydroxylase
VRLRKDPSEDDSTPTESNTRNIYRQQRIPQVIDYVHSARLAGDGVLMSTLRVAIIGGGLGGLSAALALCANGVHAQVYEQADQLGEVGAGITLYPNGLKILDRLGLGRQVSRVGTPLGAFCLHAPDGTLVSVERYRADSTPLGMHRGDLAAVLASALPDGVVQTGWRCIDFAQHDEAAVVGFEGGATVEADVVIAADGIHSVLQRYVVEPTEPVFSGMVAYRGLIPAARLPDWPRDLVAWGGQGKHLMSYPVRAGELINYVGVVPADERTGESWSSAADPAALAAEFADFNPQARRLVRTVDTTSVFGLCDREPLVRWTFGRLTLLGDAAHPMLPHMAQGTNQALEDAMALAILLRGGTRADVTPALMNYQTLRRDRTARVQRYARTNGIREDSALAVSLGHPWVLNYDVEQAALDLVPRSR